MAKIAVNHMNPENPDATHKKIPPSPQWTEVDGGSEGMRVDERALS
jgi:hypothetical protein